MVIYFREGLFLLSCTCTSFITLCVKYLKEENHHNIYHPHRAVEAFHILCSFFIIYEMHFFKLLPLLFSIRKKNYGLMSNKAQHSGAKSYILVRIKITKLATRVLRSSL